MNAKQSMPRAGIASLCCLLALGCLTASASAKGMRPLDDSALSDVRGGDGISFDLNNFSMSGNARITYYTPDNLSSAYIGNLYAARSDDPNNPFGDPYRISVIKGAAGLADVIDLAFPQNANGLACWQFAFDWGVNSNGIAFDGGSAVFKDTVFYGGGIQLSTPRSGDGFAFGLALRMDIGNILLRPRGRGDITQADAAGVAEQMNISGVRIGEVDANGNFTGKPWRIADLAGQPGVINAVTDSDGNPRLHIGIDWPDLARAPDGAALGGLQINNISFRSDVTGNLDLGSSRIGSMQIQYLDIKFRP